MPELEDVVRKLREDGIIGDDIPNGKSIPGYFQFVISCVGRTYVGTWSFLNMILTVNVHM
jgi:hypothetical protein